jgi:hypothetical protein
MVVGPMGNQDIQQDKWKQTTIRLQTQGDSQKEWNLSHVHWVTLAIRYGPVWLNVLSC